MNKITQSLMGLFIVLATLISSGCASTKSITMFNSNQLPDSELVTLKVRGQDYIRGQITHFWADTINWEEVPEDVGIVKLPPGTYNVKHSCAIFSTGKLGHPQTKKSKPVLTRDQASEFSVYAKRPMKYISSTGRYSAVGCEPIIIYNTTE